MSLCTYESMCATPMPCLKYSNSHHCPALTFLLPLLPYYSELWGMRTTGLYGCFMYSWAFTFAYTQHFDYLWLFILTSVPCNLKLLWAKLGVVQTCEQNNALLGGNLTTWVLESSNSRFLPKFYDQPGHDSCFFCFLLFCVWIHLTWKVGVAAFWVPCSGRLLMSFLLFCKMKTNQQEENFLVILKLISLSQSKLRCLYQ